jgi:hypothetical protein
MKLKSFRLFLRFALTPLFFFVFSSCQTNGIGPENTTASAMVAGSIGTALSQSGSSALQSFLSLPPTLPSSIGGAWKRALQLIPDAHAGVVCPTLLTTNGSGCSVLSATSVNLTYPGCSFSSSNAVWNGLFQESDVAGMLCGSTPSAGVLNRQALTGGLPGTATRTSVGGTLATVDHITANLNNFNNDPINPTIKSGFGLQIDLTNGSITINERIYAATFDYSISGTVAYTSAVSGTTIGGTLNVYNNKLTLLGHTAFSNLTYVPTCCLPTSGSITTSFVTLLLSNSAAARYNNKSETLTFTGCGTGNLTSIDGINQTVTLDHCL